MHFSCRVLCVCVCVCVSNIPVSPAPGLSGCHLCPVTLPAHPDPSPYDVYTLLPLNLDDSILS